MPDISPCSGAGAEVLGVDLARVGDADIDILKNSLATYGVLFFRDQEITPEQHLKFARQWGEIDVNRFFPKVEGFPEIAEVRKTAEQDRNIGGEWHTDHSYDQEPALGSILVARKLPKQGGETLFANMAAVFDSFSPGLQRTLESLNAVHSSRHVFGEQGAYARVGDTRMSNRESATQDAIHPIVIAHPVSGRPTLYVNPGFTVRIDGWTDEESQPLLNMLYARAASPEFHCRFQWRDGSVAFWDNRATWHYAINNYPGEERLMHRITVKGEALRR